MMITNLEARNRYHRKNYSDGEGIAIQKSCPDDKYLFDNFEDFYGSGDCGSSTSLWSEPELDSEYPDLSKLENLRRFDLEEPYDSGCGGSGGGGLAPPRPGPGRPGAPPPRPRPELALSRIAKPGENRHSDFQESYDSGIGGSSDGGAPRPAPKPPQLGPPYPEYHQLGEPRINRMLDFKDPYDSGDGVGSGGGNSPPPRPHSPYPYPRPSGPAKARLSQWSDFEEPYDSGHGGSGGGGTSPQSPDPYGRGASLESKPRPRIEKLKVDHDRISTTREDGYDADVDAW